MCLDTNEVHGGSRDKEHCTGVVDVHVHAEVHNEGGIRACVDTKKIEGSGRGQEHGVTVRPTIVHNKVL